MYHKWTIEQSFLQTYVSTLLFNSVCSLIRSLFKKKESKRIMIKLDMRNQWNAYLQTLESHSELIRSVTFFHDSTRLTWRSIDKTIKIWNTNNDDCLQTLKNNNDWFRLVIFSHDSTRLTSMSFDKMIKIWHASSDDCLQTLQIDKILEEMSFDLTDSSLHTEIETQ
jgi:WD40 repeat protein